MSSFSWGPTESFPTAFSQVGNSWPSPAGAFTDANSVLFASASNQYVDLGNNFRFLPTDHFSISAWVFVTSFANFPVIFGNEAAASGGFDFFFLTNGGLDLQWASHAGGEIEVQTTSTFLLNTWYHVVLTYNGSNNASGVAIYVNGASISLNVVHNTALSTPIGYGGPTRIGNDNVAQLFDGYIDEVSVWNTALSSGQVSALYNNGNPTNLANSANLTNWYRMGDANDTAATIFDQVGGINGAMHGGALIEPFIPFLFNSIGTQQVKNDANAPFLNGNSLIIPYYQSGNPNVGFDAPDLQIWSNAVPTSPVLVGTLATTFPGAITPYFCDFSGHYMFLAYSKKPVGGGPYLRVIDISTPSSPTSAAVVNYDTSTGSMFGVAVYGTHVYVSGNNATNSAGVTAIIDISNPTSPGAPSYFSTPQTPTCNPIVNGNLLYTSGITDGTIKIFDVTTPTSPSLVSTITCAFPPWGMNIFGKYLYVAEQNGLTNSKVEIIDISNPASPNSVKTFAIPNPGILQGTVIPGRNLLIIPTGTIQGTGILYAVAIYDPLNPFIATTYNMGSIGGFTKAPDYITSINDIFYVTSNVITSPGDFIDFASYLDIFQL